MTNVYPFDKMSTYFHTNSISRKCTRARCVWKLGYTPIVIAISGKIRHLFDMLQINPQLQLRFADTKNPEKTPATSHPQPPSAIIHGTFSDGSGSSTSIPLSARASRMTWSFWASMTGKEIVSFEWVENWRIQKPFIDIHRSLSVWKICTCIYISVCACLVTVIYIYIWYLCASLEWNIYSVHWIANSSGEIWWDNLDSYRFEPFTVYTGMNYEHVGDGSKRGTTLPSPKSESQSVLSFQDRIW